MNKQQLPSIKPTPLKSKLKAREVRKAIREVKAEREARERRYAAAR